MKHLVLKFVEEKGIFPDQVGYSVDFTATLDGEEILGGSSTSREWFDYDPIYSMILEKLFGEDFVYDPQADTLGGLPFCEYLDDGFTYEISIKRNKDVIEE